jgi:hypothetical protein
MNTYAISGLRRKYAQALGRVKAGEPDAATDLEHLGAVLLMFSPDEDLSAIQPIRPYPSNRDRWMREALAVLREASEPMTAKEIALRLLTARGVAHTYRNVQRIQCSLYVVLGRLEGRGIERVSEAPRRWAREVRSAR